MESFFNLPAPVRLLLGLLTVTSILGAVALIDPQLVFVVLIGMIVLTGALVVYHYILKAIQKRKSDRMRGDIAGVGNTAPGGISKPDQLAKLDSMRRSFELGMEKFRTSGKDVYTLPWYCIVGEPGAGKTEAIRHCNVGFPPGLQDEMQGVGGTINMNWWFTNRAVLLDTAGRLMFEEVAPGETHEWPEFLKLLRRNRPNCPINGLLLVIPCDSLVKDSETEITRKAGKIAQQLEVIQRALDVRFPVFVLITKSDLLDGFREFFDDMDAESQHQMLGWSNPEPRDAPFRPDQVDIHLQTVIARIRKRRLGLLKDPVPQKGAPRRADEVDSLYSLPESFALAAPKLRSYLEKIFVAGPWSAKPLFLRGIYFTSAMREGKALDLVLAQAIGVRVEELPEGRAWERERAYFLRDLFTEKIFREYGLVTRASNTTVLLRKRQAILYGFGFLAFAVLLVSSILSYLSFRDSIGKQSDTWAYAANPESWKNGRWNPIVSSAGAGQYQYDGDKRIDERSGAETLSKFHDKLRALCETPVEVGWVYRPLWKAKGVDDDLKKAQRIVFEAGVVKSVVNSVREQMVARDSILPDTSPPEQLVQLAAREAKAIAALLYVEADVLTKTGIDPAPNDIFKPSINYVASVAPEALDNSFPSSDFSWTYTKSPNSRHPNVWPPEWLTGNSASLKKNEPINAGLNRMFNFLNSGVQKQEGLKDFGDLRDDLSAFRSCENQLNTQAATNPDAKKSEEITTTFKQLQKFKASIDEKIQKNRTNNRLISFSLVEEFKRLNDQSEAQSKAAIDIVSRAISDKNVTTPLFKEVADALKSQGAKHFADISNRFSATELADLDMLLKDAGDGRHRVYEVRTAQYEAAEAEVHKFDNVVNLLGKGWIPLKEMQSHLAQVGTETEKIQGMVGAKFDACRYFLKRALTQRTNNIVDKYLEQTRKEFDGKFYSPVVSGPGSKGRLDIKAAKSSLDTWRDDLNPDNLKSIPPTEAQKLQNFENKVKDINDVIAAEIKADEVRRETKIILELPSYPGNSGLGEWRALVRNEGAVDVTNRQGSVTIGTFPVDAIGCDVRFRQFESAGEYGTAHVNFKQALSDRNYSARVNGGTAINFSVTATGPMPPPVPPGPDKSKILAILN